VLYFEFSGLKKHWSDFPKLQNPKNIFLLFRKKIFLIITLKTVQGITGDPNKP